MGAQIVALSFFWRLTMSTVKETKDLISLAFALAKVIKPELKDGWQLSDLQAIAQGVLSEEFVAEVKAAIEGADKIPEETADVGLFEGIELARFVLGKIKELQAV